MRRARRRVMFAVLGTGVAMAAQLAALAPAQAASPTITIKATSKFRPVTGDHFVVFQDGKYASARIHGTITGATADEVATLYARQFPYTKPAKPVASVTLSPAGTTTPYSFTVTPNLATRYKVKLFASSTATTPLATSPTQNLYVLPKVLVNNPQQCARPVCRERFRIRTFLPNSALRFEMKNHLYPYFGLRLGATSIPPPPKWLYLNGGNARVSASSRISATEFARTLRFSFRIGNHSYYWLWNACNKDFVSKDGLGLPGHHGCGARRIARTVHYLG